MKVANTELRLLALCVDKESMAMYSVKKPQLKDISMIRSEDIPREILLSDRNDSDSVSIASSLVPSTLDTLQGESHKRKYQNFMEPISMLPIGRPLTCPPNLPFGLPNANGPRAGNKKTILQSQASTTTLHKKQRLDRATLSLAPISVPRRFPRAMLPTEADQNMCAPFGVTPWTQSMDHLSNGSVMSRSDESCAFSRTNGGSVHGSNSTIASAVDEYHRMPPARHTRITLLSLVATHLMEESEGVRNCK